VRQTNPICRPAGGEDPRQGQKPWRCRPSPGQSRETNPISGEPKYPSFQPDADCAKQSQFARAPRNGRGRPGPGGLATNCAKRSQFGCSAGAPEAEIRETNPISEEDSGLKCQAIVRNKANLATGLGEAPQGARAAREASCTNKPNLPIGTSGRRGRAQSPVEPSRGPVAANKANSRPSGRREGSGIRPRATDAPGRGDRYNSLAVSRGCR
jgi:hypothetical protein